MIEMSNSKQRASDLKNAYDHSLEQQILGRGSTLVCRDEELWKQVEGRLRDGDAQETHCLGLDPLSVMEESLKAATAVTTAASGGQVKARGGGLQGLAKAFEVLEQAALNLYLSPWREEYKIVKMYSGMFTHYIKPVLSMPQIEKLFGLLGYQPSSSRHEQLFLQVLAVSLDELLRLCCAFYLARCECRLLQAALGRHVGDAQWELSLVRERQKGNSLQVSLDNTKKTLRVSQPLMEPFDGESDMDLYTDEHINGRQREAVVNNGESRRSLDSPLWLSQRNAPAAVKPHSNGVTQQLCISTLSCQPPKMTPLESESTRVSSSSAGRGQARRPYEESGFDNGEAQSVSLQLGAMGLSRSVPETNHFCTCLQSSPLCPNHCTECNTLHDITCDLLQHCKMSSHSIVRSYITPEETEAASAQGECPDVADMSAIPLTSSGGAAMSSLGPRDVPESLHPSLPPITYHDCCNLAQLDPQLLCRSCNVFHSRSCRDADRCQSQRHEVQKLGVCLCGKACPRNPLVLCRYCGKEYCRDCWYRNPVTCICGQTFDQSSPV